MALHMNFNLSPFLAAAPAFDHVLDAVVGAHPLVRHMPRLHKPDVVETKRGYLITAHLPGVSANDVNVGVEHCSDSSSRLTLRAGDRLTEDYCLPSHLIVASQTRASMIDGVLRVVIPKKAEVEIPITVGCASALSDDDESNHKAYNLEAPGFSAKDITVNVKLPEHRVIVEGKSEQHGAFKHSLPLPTSVDAATAAMSVSANIINGMLTVRVTNPSGTKPAAIPVHDEMPVLPDANQPANTDHTTGVLKLMEQAVPGMGAGDVKVEVTANRVVRVTADVKEGDASSHKRCHRHFALHATLPQGVDAASVRAYCAHGLLTITTDKPTAPVHHNIEVSATELASIDNTTTQSA